MSRITPGSSYTTPGAQRTISSIQQGQRNHPYSNSPSTSAQKYTNRNTLSGGGTVSSASPRALQRQVWVRTFGGPSYLEGGQNNRMTLSIKSSIPAEIDWALNRFIIISGSEPDIIRLQEFPGLLEGLLNLISTFVDMREREKSDGSAALFGAWRDEGREKIRIRATEAGMIMRNLATDKGNLKQLIDNKRLRRVITSVLEEGDGDRVENEESAELRVYLLELLEYVADSTPLVLPGRALSRIRNSIPELDTSPSVRLFPLLVALTYSPDRALVLASFRCLAALSSNEISDPVLSLATYNSPDISTRHKYAHPIQRAIDLLTLADQELTITILNFIYQHTLLPSNAALFCARPELGQILNLICTKLHLGASMEVLNVTIPMPDTDAAKWYDSLPPRHKSVVVNGPTTALSLKLGALDPLRMCPEPQRAMTWMRTVFEENAACEITQVALWTSYRVEFDSSEVTILAAAELIKMVSEAFPTALPMVTETGEERRFIINGIRPRDRTDLKTIFVCRWQGCPTPSRSTSSSQLYSHLHHSHLAVPTPPTQCSWLHCKYVASSSPSNPLLLANELSVHVRSHIPVYTAPPGYGSTPPTVKTLIPITNPYMEEPITTIEHTRYHNEKDDQGEPTGIGYLCCLILRNVARTVKTASTSISGGPSMGTLREEGESIFEELDRAATEGGLTVDPVITRLEKVDYTKAKQAIAVLVGMEEKLVNVALQDNGLGKLLGPVLAVITKCSKIVV